MLVVLTKQQVLSTKQICSNCLMADSAGLPRWHQGQLSCGRLLEPSQTKPVERSCICHPIYECQMGFHLVNIR